ncbi:MAG: serine/threonine-protein kinase [Myxococcota bacterium]
MDEASLDLGMVVGDRYSVEALVGLGGLAEVYRVRHLELGSVHALKLLTWNRKSLTERLLLEGRIQAQLTHPHIVRVTDVVRIERRVGLLLEFIEGPSLEEFLEHHGALSVPDALGLFAPVLAAVAHAHDAGVLHRDLKPANVLLARAPGGWVPKVADFGLAKVVEDGLGPNTRTGISMGTPGYMPPEQVRNSASADVRTDVFALGSVLYEMIAGRRAYAPPDGSEIELTATIDRRPPPLEDVSVEVWNAISKALEPERDARFDDARAFAKALGIESHPSLSAAPDLVPVPLALDPSTYPSDPSADAMVRSQETTPPFTEPASDPPRTAGPVAVLAVLGSVLASVVVTALLTQPVLESRKAREAAKAAKANVVTVVEPPPSPKPLPPVKAEVEAQKGSPAIIPAPAHPPLAFPEATAAPKPSPTVEPKLIEVLAPEEGTETPEEAAEEEGSEPSPMRVAVPAEETAPQDVEGPAPVPEGPSLPIGTYEGEADGRPFELRVTVSNGGRVVADAVFLPLVGLGSPRVEALEGTFDPTSRELLLRSPSSRLVFSGKLSGQVLEGQYMRGSKSQVWRVNLP